MEKIETFPLPLPHWTRYRYANFKIEKFVFDNTHNGNLSSHIDSRKKLYTIKVNNVDVVFVSLSLQF
jgi:hypothetical protein